MARTGGGRGRGRGGRSSRQFGRGNVVLAKPIHESFADRRKVLGAAAERGLIPFNRAVLDFPEVLVSAPEDIQKERTHVLKLRNTDLLLSHAAAPPSQMNLLAAGTARLLGGEEAASHVVERTSQTLNFTGHNASDIMTLFSSKRLEILVSIEHTTHLSQLA